MLVSLSIAMLVAQPVFGDLIPWGTVLDQVSEASRVKPAMNEPPDREGLIHGADATVQGPGGMPFPLSFYFTPLTKKLARIDVHPSKSICEPLLPELREEFGDGVDLTEFAEIRHWVFSDIRTSSRWDFYITYAPKDRSLQSCSIIAHPLIGTQ